MKDFLRRFFGVLLSVTMIFTSCVFPVFSVADEAQTGTVTEDTESILRLEVLKQLYEEMQQWVSENEGKELIDAPSAEIFLERVNALSGKERGVLVDQLIPGLYAICANETTGELELVETAQADALMEQTSVPGTENAQLTGLEDAVTPDQQLGGEGGSEIELPNLDPAGLVDELDQIPDDADLDLDVPGDDSDDPTADLELEDVDDLDQVDDPEANEDLEQVDELEEVDDLDQVDELEDADTLEQVDDPEADKDLEKDEELEDVDEPEQIDDPEADKDLEKDEELEDADDPDQVDDQEADKDLEKDEELEDADEPEQVVDPEADKDLEKDEELEDVDEPEQIDDPEADKDLEKDEELEDADDPDQVEQQNDEQNIQSQDVSAAVNTETDKSVKTSEEPADETDETVTVYTVTFEVGGDLPEGYAAPEAMTAAAGEQVDVPAAGSYEGYEFSGWFSEDVSVDGSFTMPENDVIISGEWEKQEYTVRYEYDETAPDGTVLPESGTYAYGDEVTVTDPQMEGYTFNGWTSEEVSLDGGVFRMPAGDVTLTGSWSAIQAPRPKMLKMGKKSLLGAEPPTGSGTDDPSSDGKTNQIITVSDVTATYGDTDKSVSATTTGGGAISYAVKDGSEAYINVASDGKLTIKSVPADGEAAYVTVTAAENDAYAAATTDVLVTINRARITVKAIDQSIYVGGEVPDLSSPELNKHYTVTGLVGEDTLTTPPKLAYQSGESEATPNNTAAGTYDIVASGASASDNYTIAYEKGTLTISDKQTQTIAVSAVEATYGDTNKSVSASVTNPATGGGTISYAVKAGSEEYIEVNFTTGVLTIKKVPLDGTAYVIATAAETATCNSASQVITVTISKAPITPEVSLTSWNYGSEAEDPDVIGNPGNGAVTYKYKQKDAEDTTYSKNVPTEVGEYTVKAEIAETDNYLSGTATANFSIFETFVTATIGGADSANVTYNGQDWASKVNDDDALKIAVSTVAAEGSQGTLLEKGDDADSGDYHITVPEIKDVAVDGYDITVHLHGGYVSDGNNSKTLKVYVKPAIASVTFDNYTDYYDRAPWNNRIGLNDKLYNHNIVVTANLGGENPYQLNATGVLPEISMSVNDGKAATEANTDGYTVTLTAGNNFCFTSGESPVSRTTTVKFKVLPAEISNPAKFDTQSVVYDREDWAPRMKECSDPYEQKDGTIQLIVFANENLGEGKEAEKIQLKAGEYSITKPEGGLTEVYRYGGADEPHPYDVEWTLTDTATANFVIDSNVPHTAPFMITPAVISGVKINGEAAAEIDYRAWDWQNSVKTDGTATPADELVSTAKDQIVFLVTAELSGPDQVAKPDEINLRMETMLNVGEYVIEVLLADDNNFEWDEEAEHTVTLTVKRHEVNPLTFSKSYITDSGETTADGAGGTFIFGAADSILEFTAEPGEVLLISLDDGTAKEYTVDGTRFEKHGEKNEPVKVTFTVSETGNVTLTSGAAGDVALGSLADNEKHILTISYKDAANLYDTNEEADPAILTNGVRFDNTAPIIELLSYKNREETATVVAHESGYLDGFYAGPDTSVNRLVDADQGIQIDVADAEGATTQQEVRLNWNGSGSPSLIHSGSTTLEYRDLAGNVTRLDFAEPSQSSGIEFEVELVPSKKENNGYLDSSEMAERDVLELTISGQPYEAVAVSFDGYSGMNYSFTMPGDGGAWSAGAAPTSYSEKVSLAGVAQGQQINFSVKYDDLIGSYEDYFYYDNVVDPVILTSLPITEDMFILSGIVEYKAYSVRVFVNGQQIPSSNVKLDAFGVFTALLPMLTEGDQITIVVTDLANNTQTFGPYPVGPMTNSKTLKGYSMGKVYTTAHQTKENETPDSVMVTKLGEDELQAGITLPLVAANSFRYGTVTLKLEGGQVVAEPELLEGATVVGDSYVGVISAKNADGDFYRQFMGASGRPGATIEAGQGEYYVCFQQQVTLESSLMESSFQLENGGDNADRQLYLKCQRRQRLTAEQE